jgi:acetyl-CoA carboxylase biotin carboxyl carrier protein
MEADEIRQLGAWLKASGFRCLELSRPGECVRLTLSGGRKMAVESRARPADTAAAYSGTAGAGRMNTPVLTQTAGVFLAAHPACSTPLTTIGSFARENDVLGLLKIGLIYAPVYAPADGVVVKIFAVDGELLGFGSPVLELGPAAA